MLASRRDLGLIALVGAFTILAAAVLGTLLLFQGQQRAQARVIHTLEVEEKLSRVFSRLQDAETGQRGYIITGDPKYLEPYHAALRTIDADLTDLRTAISDNPSQRARAAELTRAAKARIDRLGVGAGLMRAGQREGAADAIRHGVGKHEMDLSRAIITAMKADESGLLAERIRVAQRQSTLLTAWLLLSAAAVAAMAFFVTRNARARARDLAQANARLIEEAASREAAEAQIRQMHKIESIGQLTGGIAHDFNNMLAIVIGSLDLAKRRLPRDRKTAE